MRLNSDLKVSVIVPVYGEAEYLPSCIESIQKQTYKNLEIILVDDGSPDSCPTICDYYAKKDKRIRVVHKINSGLVEARKTGIRLASGYYVIYVDGDDEIVTNYIEKLVKIAKDNDVDVVADGFCKSINGKRTKYLNSLEVGRYNKNEMKAKIYPYMISCCGFYSFGIFTYIWGKLFKRKNLVSNQLSVPSQLIIGEDSSCIYPLLFDVKSIFITDVCGYIYRQRTGSLLRLKKNDSSMLMRLKLCYNYLRNRFYEMKVFDIMRNQLNNYIISQMLMLSDCIVELDPILNKSFPFLNINPNDKVIIYSAGAFGMHLYSQYINTKCCSIVALCDPDNEYLGDNVISFQESIQKEFDKIVVASVDRKFIDSAIQLIQSYGISKNIILTIDDNKDFVYKYCERLLKG